MKQHFFYLAADFFMVRFANLPFHAASILEKEDPNELIKFYHSNPLFKEAIAIASFDLHQALKKWDTIVDKKPLIQSLSKYLLRMSSRTTPFGLFSSVGWGQFGEQTEISFQDNFLKKKASLGTEYIGEIVKNLEIHLEIVKKLKVRLNPQLIYKNGRIFLHNDHPTFQEDYISIKQTTAFNKIHEIANIPVPYFELVEALLTHFPLFQKEKIEGYVWELFQKNYLISEFMDPQVFIRFEESYEQILEKIDSQFALDSFPIEIMETLRQYEQEEEHKKRIVLIEKITTELRNRKGKIKNPFKIDHFYEPPQIYLHKNVQNAVEKAVALLVKISPFPKNLTILQNFHRSFLEKYGTERLVPFFETLQSDQVLNLFSNETEEKIEKEDTLLENYLIKQSHIDEIDLEQLSKEIELLPPRDQKSLPPTMELCCEIETNEEKGIQENRFNLLVKGISTQAGAMFGRFLYFWEKDKKKILEKWIDEEKKILPSVLLIEPSFIPEKHRVGNVSFGLKLRSLQLPMHYFVPTNDTMELEDLYLGADFEKIYIYSKKYNKEVLISPSVMTNYIYYPLPLRFLLFLSQYQVDRSLGLIWKNFGNRVYYPRVIYQNVILSPAQWHLSFSLLNIDPSSSKEQLALLLKKAFQTYKVPKKALLTQGDNYLPIQWEKEWHFDLLVKEFSKGNGLLLHENRIDKQKNATPNHANHAKEFVIPVKKRPLQKLSLLEKMYPQSQQIPIEKRVAFPGGNWWYAKIFLPSRDADFFLSRFLLPFMNSLEENCPWFFIRYRTEDFHLRLRIRIDSQSLRTKMVPMLDEWLSSLALQGEINDFELSSYKKEIERYGGPKSIELAEEVFHHDSLVILRMLEKKEFPFPSHVLASITILNIAHCFYPDINDLLPIFPSHPEQAYLLEGLRPYSKRAISFVIALMTGEKKTWEDERLQFLFDLFTQLHPSLDNFAKKVFELEVQNELWGSPKQIIDNLIHMHINRLLGISFLEEKKVRITASYFLEKIIFQMKFILNESKRKN